MQVLRSIAVLLLIAPILAFLAILILLTRGPQEVWLLVTDIGGGLFSNSVGRNALHRREKADH